MSDDRNTDNGGGWQPHPQGEYDSDATAFVQLPEGMLDVPLAAPGHGYVPPQITVTPTTADATDPAATGSWVMPPEVAGGYDATGQWTFAGTEAAQTQAYGQGQGYGQQEHLERLEHQGYEPSEHPGYESSEHPGYEQSEPLGYDHQGYEQGHSQGYGQSYAHPGAAPSSDVTGQWSIPVAEGELPDDSGEYTASAQAGGYPYGTHLTSWPGGGTPPATLPGGAPAPWATGAGAGAPWGEQPQETPEQPAAEPAPQEPREPREPRENGFERTTLLRAVSVPPAGQSGIEAARAAEAALAAEAVQEMVETVQEAAEAAEAAEIAAVLDASDPAEQFESAEQTDPTDGALDDAFPRPFAEAAPEATQEAEPAALPEAASQAAPEAPDGAPVVATPDTPPEHAEDAPAEPAVTPEPIALGPVAAPEPAPAPEPMAGPEHADAPDTAAGTAEAPAEAVEAAEPDTEAGEHTAPDDDAAAETADAPVIAPNPLHDDHPLGSYVLRVNGTDRPVTDAWIGESLLYVLRERLGLAGAKDGCSQGECGACNVQVDGRLVASCLVPAATTAGSEIRTVEGLATDGQPSDVQRALAACGAVQCGFCVPGMAMTVHDLLEGNPAPSELETRRALCGNLCRCSGYRGVLDAVREVVAEREASAAADTPASAAERAEQGDEARIPHQAAPGAGGVHQGAYDEGPYEGPRGPFGQDGGQA